MLRGAINISRASIEATANFGGLRLTIACVSLQIYVSIVLYSLATTQNDCTFLISEIELGKSTYKIILSLTRPRPSRLRGSEKELREITKKTPQIPPPPLPCAIEINQVFRL